MIATFDIDPAVFQVKTENAPREYCAVSIFFS